MASTVFLAPVRVERIDWSVSSAYSAPAESESRMLVRTATRRDAQREARWKMIRGKRRRGRTGLDGGLRSDVVDADLLEERRSVGVLGVVDLVVAQVGTEAGVGPGQVAGVGRLVVLVRDELDHVVALGLVVRLDDWSDRVE